ncbi:MAG: hypothetical protein U9Q66_03455 [Patescibacteria group bacterium]|nr:hypothetical protein [Patescibacteria group bacterium]
MSDDHELPKYYFFTPTISKTHQQSVASIATSSIEKGFTFHPLLAWCKA